MVDPLVKVELVLLIDALAGVAFGGRIVEWDRMVIVYPKRTGLHHLRAHQFPAGFVVVGVKVL